MAFTPAPINLNTPLGGTSFPIDATGAGVPGGSQQVPNPAYSNIFIPAIWSSKILEKFYDASVLPAISNTDYEGEVKSFGDKVVIRTRPSLEVNDYEAYGQLNYQTPSSNSITLSIDQGKYQRGTLVA